MASPLPTKTCATCGRPFAWRKAWRRDWDGVKYCSQRCRGERPNRVDRDLEAAILDLLRQRGRSATICPSEATRLVDGEERRHLMERTLRAGRRLSRARVIEILQGRRVADPDAAKGPIRYRLRRPSVI